MATPWNIILAREAFEKRNSLPETPGVYFFLNAGKEPLYIGKATSLFDRVKSYFAQDLEAKRGPKIRRMLELAAFIAYRPTESVLEALLEESLLIKKYQPPYNTDAKDDKSYQQVVITREKFPRVLIVRGRDLEQGKFRDPVKYFFGPFPSGTALRESLKIIRKMFPFRDRCRPYEKEGNPPSLGKVSLERKESSRVSREPEGKGRPCFSAQVGLCPGVCTGSITAREYQRTIGHIRMFFSGRKTVLIRKLEGEMKRAAADLAFERALELKRMIFSLRHIQDIALVREERGVVSPHRIEAYDVAHLGGSASVGVMTVVRENATDTSQYRLFKLRGTHGGNDLTALEEILQRRFSHSEWPWPDILVVDGAEAQAEVAHQSLLRRFGAQAGKTIVVVGVVKNAKHKPERFIGPESVTGRFEKGILLANSEAHRFAITFHRKRRGKEFLPPQ